MTERYWIWISIALTVLLPACTPVEDTTGPAEMTETAPSEATTALPPAAVLIGHPVADYDAWKTVFDGFEPTRREDGILGHTVKRGIDDPNVVYVYCPANDLAGLEAHLVGDALAEAMKNAGVSGEPEVRVLEPMTRDLVAGQLPGIIVMHAVEDYADWRAAYENFDATRRRFGIIGHAVSAHVDDPNRLVVYHQGNDVESLRAFVESTELEEAMQAAGVIGEPDIRFIEVVEFANY